MGTLMQHKYHYQRYNILAVLYYNSAQRHQAPIWPYHGIPVGVENELKDRARVGGGPVAFYRDPGNAVPSHLRSEFLVD